jgi:formate dehydrogenase maturation protein FdhE
MYGDRGMTPELCPVCQQSNQQIVMVTDGKATGFYYVYKCPLCKGEFFMEVEKEVNKKN